MKENNNGDKRVSLAIMSTNIEYIKKDVESIKTKMEVNYVSKVEFEPIKKLVYGMVSLFLIAVMGGILRLVVSQ